jgi:hypothetical protein
MGICIYLSENVSYLLVNGSNFCENSIIFSLTIRMYCSCKLLIVRQYFMALYKNMIKRYREFFVVHLVSVSLRAVSKETSCTVIFCFTSALSENLAV